MLSWRCAAARKFERIGLGPGIGHWVLDLIMPDSTVCKRIPEELKLAKDTFKDTQTCLASTTFRLWPWVIYMDGHMPMNSPLFVVAEQELGANAANLHPSSDGQELLHLEGERSWCVH